MIIIYAIYLAIWSNYTTINIYGADMSFHKDIDVDQENNELIIRFKHFNSEDTIERLMKNPEKIIPSTMYSETRGMSIVFHAHELCDIYAKKQNIRIVNCSSYSMIDAYDRSK